MDSVPAMVGQKSTFTGTLKQEIAPKKQEIISLIFLFLCIIHIENIYAQISEHSLWKVSWIGLLQLVSYMCVGAMIAPVYGTVEKNRQGNLVILCSSSVSIVCLGGVLEKSTVLKRFADNSK